MRPSRIIPKKLIALAASGLVFALCPSAQAQQRPPVPKIGVLSSAGSTAAPGSQIEAFRQGLRQLGYIDGHNILVEYRYAQGEQDRMPSLVSELVQLKVDVLVVTALTAIRAAKHATKTIPIVMVILSVSTAWHVPEETSPDLPA